MQEAAEASSPKPSPVNVALAVDWFIDWSSSEAAGAYRLAKVLLLAIFGASSVTLIALGAPPISGPWDVMALLDESWRIICGQVPHTDFHNPIGPLPYLPIVLGMKIAGPSTASFGYGSVVVLALLAPWAWLIFSRRLPAAIAFAFALWFGFLLISPRPLGYGIRQTSYAMIYNRGAYALLSMLLVSAFLPPRTASRGHALLGGLSMGVLLALIFYSKITYFIVGAASVLLAFVLDRRGWRPFGAVVAGAGLVAVVVRVLLHVDTASYLADVAFAAHSQSPALRLSLLSAAFVDEISLTYLALLFLAFWASAERGLDDPPPPSWRPQLIALWVLGVALVVASGNTLQVGRSEDPLYLTAAIVFVELCRRRVGTQLAVSRSPVRLVYAASLLVMLPLFGGAMLIRDVASLSYAAVWNLTERTRFDDARYLHSTPLRDFRVPASTSRLTAYWPARDHPANINDGIDLLRRHLTAGDQVTTIAYANPFSFALGLKPARDGLQWWDLHLSFDEKHLPPAEDFLGQASLVMVPRLLDREQGWSFETVDVLLKAYAGFLQANFDVVEASKQWLLYRRRSSLPSGKEHGRPAPLDP